jgi:hypothetical protein
LITGRVILFGVFLGCLGSIGVNPAFCQDEPVPSGPVPADFGSALTPTSNERDGLIHLDVSVKDRNGDSRTGLSGKEFTLLDDGVPAKILSFRTVNEAGAEGDEIERLSEVVLVLDHVNLSDLQFSLVKRETIKYLRQNGGRLARPTTVYLFALGALYASAIATTDGNALAEDIARDRFPRTLADPTNTRRRYQRPEWQTVLAVGQGSADHLHHRRRAARQARSKARGVDGVWMACQPRSATRQNQ